MKLRIFLAALVILAASGSSGVAADPSHKGHDMQGSSDMDHTAPTGTFTHQAVVDGVRAEFDIMSLQSMNMTDPEGRTHHIMVKFFHEAMNHQIQDATGKVKVIGPAGQEQIESLKNYGGIFAANVNFPESGKYGVICLIKSGDKKYLYKFWYHHAAQ
jgi:hypothetical protein